MPALEEGCTWPFHADPDCEKCKEWEARATRNLEEYAAQVRLRKGSKSRK